MTTDQAIAILEAERVLQNVGCDGPDSVPGTPWNDYVKQAYAIVFADDTIFESFSDIHLLEDC